MTTLGHVTGFDIVPATNKSLFMSGYVPIDSSILSMVSVDFITGPNSPMMGPCNLNDPCSLCTNKQCSGHPGVANNLETYLNIMLKQWLVVLLRYITPDGSLKLAPDIKKKLVKKAETFPDIMKALNVIKNKTIQRAYKSEEDIAKYRKSDLPTIEYKTSSAWNVATCVDLDDFRKRLEESEWKLFGPMWTIFLDALFCKSLYVLPNPHRVPTYDPIKQNYATCVLTLYPPMIIRASQEAAKLRYSQDVHYTSACIKYFETIRNYFLGKGNIPQLSPRAVSSMPPDRILVLTGKSGLIRGDSLKKRMENTFRGTIICDSNLPPTKVGIPINVLMEMTTDEVVTSDNIDSLDDLSRCQDEYPHIKWVVTKHGKVDYNHPKFSDLSLEEGDIIRRTMRHTDLILNNRPPSIYATSTYCLGCEASPIRGGIPTNPKSLANGQAGDCDGDQSLNLLLRDSDSIKEAGWILNPFNYGKDSINGEYLYSDGAGPKFVLIYIYTYRPKISRFTLIKDFWFIDFKELLIGNKSEFIEIKDVLEYLLPREMNFISKSCFDDSYGPPEEVIVQYGQLNKGSVDGSFLDGKVGANYFDWMFTNLGYKTSAEKLHQITRFLDNIGMQIIAGYVPSEMHISDENWNEMGEYMMAKKWVANHVLSFYASIPQKYTLHGTKLQEAYMVESFDPMKERAMILASLKSPRENAVILTGIAKRGSDKDVVSLGNISQPLQMGGKFPINDVQSRISATSTINDASADGIGFLDQSYVKGTSTDAFQNGIPLCLKVLIQRVEGTQVPGMITRKSRIILSGVFSSKHCILYEGTPDTSMKFLSFRSNFWNSNVSYGIRVKYSDMEAIFDEAVEVSPSELSDLAERNRDLIRDNVRNTNDIRYGITSVTFVELPFNFSHLPFDSVEGHITEKQAIAGLQQFFVKLDCIFFGHEYFDDHDLLPNEFTDGFCTIKLAMIWYLFTGGYKHYKKEEYQDFLVKVLIRIGFYIPPENYSIGSMSALNYARISTQRTLSAPKSKTGYSQEMEDYIKRFCSFPAQTKEYKFVPDVPHRSYNQFITMTLESIISGYRCYGTYPYEKECKFTKMTENPKMMYLVLLFDETRMIEIGTTIFFVILRIMKFLDNPVELIDAENDTYKVLCPIECHDFDSFQKVLSDMKKNIIITRASGIISIKEIAVKDWTEVFIKATSYEACFQINGVTMDNLIPLHPMEVYEHYGALAGYVASHLGLMDLYAEVTNTSAFVTAEAMCTTGEVVPLTSSYFNKINTSNMLANVAMGRSEFAIIKTMNTHDKITCNNDISSMITGGDNLVGTKTFIRES